MPSLMKMKDQILFWVNWHQDLENYQELLLEQYFSYKLANHNKKRVLNLDFKKLPATADNKVLKDITKCFVVIKFLNRQNTKLKKN